MSLELTEECNHFVHCTGLSDEELDQNATSEIILTVWIITCLFNPLLVLVQIDQEAVQL